LPYSGNTPPPALNWRVWQIGPQSDMHPTTQTKCQPKVEMSPDYQSRDVPFERVDKKGWYTQDIRAEDRATLESDPSADTKPKTGQSGDRSALCFLPSFWQNKR